MYLKKTNETISSSCTFYQFYSGIIRYIITGIELLNSAYSP